MTLDELRASNKCGLCGRAILHTRLPIFWKIKISRFGVRVDKARRVDALAQVVGNQRIAEVLSPDTDMVEPLMDPVELAVCEPCSTAEHLPIAAIAMHYAPRQ